MPTLEERVAELEALIGASKKGSEIDSTIYNENNSLIVHSQSDNKIKKLQPTLLPFLSSEKETYYGNFRYLTGIPNDLDYTFADDFTLAKTIENKYYFISKLGDLNNHKIYLNKSGEFFRLNEANRVAEKKAWEIEGLTGTFTPNQLFKFNRWIESGYWKSPKVVVVAPHETFNFPKSFKDDVFIVEVYNDKGIPQTNGTFRLGGYLSASHQTILSAKQDSNGGNYGTAAHQFLIINQRKQTVISYYDSFDDFPNPGDPNILYVEEENDTTWFWSPGDNDYQSLGEVVRGELIDSTTFKDILGVPVMPSPEKTYIDVTVTPKVEYLWDGAQYVPIGSTSSNQIIFYNSAGPPAVVGQSGILYIQIETGAAFIWNDGWISIGGGYDWTYLGNQKHLKYNSTTQRPENSNIEDTATGVSVEGDVIMPGIDKEYIDAEETGKIAVTKEWINSKISLNEEIDLELTWDGGEDQLTKKFWNNLGVLVTTAVPAASYFGACEVNVESYQGKDLQLKILTELGASTAYCHFCDYGGAIIESFRNGTIGNPTSWLVTKTVPANAVTLKLSNIFYNSGLTPINDTPYVRYYVESDNDIATAFQNLQDEVAALQSLPVKLIVPAYIDTYVGAKIQLFKSAMISSFAKDSFYVKISTGTNNIGKDYLTHWQHTIANTTPITLQVYLYDENHNIIDDREITIRAKAVPGSITQDKVLFIGDSLTYYNRIPDEFKRFVTTNTASTTQADTTAAQTVVRTQGLGLSSLTLYGTQKINHLGWTGAEFHEGRSGFSALDLISSGSPFYISGAYNFNQYLVNNSFTDTKAVFIGLGWNDIFEYSTIESFHTHLNALITGIRSALPTAKIYLWSENMPSLLGGIGNHPYGSNAKINMVVWRYGMMRCREIMFQLATSLTNVIYIDSSIWVDDRTGAQFSAQQVNYRTDEDINLGNDDVHPSDSGFFQLTDAIVQAFIYHQT